MEYGMLPAESKRVLGWRGLRAGERDAAWIRRVPGRWQYREKKAQGCGWRGMGQVGGCRWTEERGIEGGAAGLASATGFCYPTGCPRSPYLQELRLQPWVQSQMSAPGAATSLASPAAPLAASRRIRAETSPCAPPGGQRVPGGLRARPRTPPSVRGAGTRTQQHRGMLRCHRAPNTLRIKLQNQRLGALFSPLILDDSSGEWHSVS